MDAVKAVSLQEILAIVIIGCVVYWALFYQDRLHGGIPTAGADPKAWFKVASARKAFLADGKGVIQKALKDVCVFLTFPDNYSRLAVHRCIPSRYCDRHQDCASRPFRRRDQE